MHVAVGRAELDIGAGLRGGFVELAGDSRDSMVQTSSFWSPWFGPFASGTATLPIAGRVAIDAAVETGHGMGSASGVVDARRVPVVEGTWLQLHIGLSVVL